MYMGKLTMPRYASNAIDHIKALVNTETYRHIEDDLSIIRTAMRPELLKSDSGLALSPSWHTPIEELR